MVVAFMDLLGFSILLKTDSSTAIDNLNSISITIQTKDLDQRTHPLSEYQKNYPNDNSFLAFVEKSSITSFKYMINFSDSLILGSDNIDLFVSQLTNLIATFYIRYSEPFCTPFEDIKDVKSNRSFTSLPGGTLVKHNAFPILFRGGVAVGDDVFFYKDNQINNDQFMNTSLNVTGKTYLSAVDLEKRGKGPRLFCDETLVNKIANKKIIRCVDKFNNLYEIVWTIEGCEATGSSSNAWNNIYESIYFDMLPPAVNLYKYYCNDAKIKPQYEELLNLVCCGIIKYAEIECPDRISDAIDAINLTLSKSGLPIEYDRNILKDFLE